MNENERRERWIYGRAPGLTARGLNRLSNSKIISGIGVVTLRLATEFFQRDNAEVFKSIAGVSCPRESRNI